MRLCVYPQGSGLYTLWFKAILRKPQELLHASIARISRIFLQFLSRLHQSGPGERVAREVTQRMHVTHVTHKGYYSSYTRNWPSWPPVGASNTT